MPQTTRWRLAWLLCDILGWHRRPKYLWSDGCSLCGACPRCERFVLQDSQGNWFESEVQR